MILAALTIGKTCYAYDLEDLLEAKNRNVVITMTSGVRIEGVVWDVVKAIEDESNTAKVVRYSVTSQDFSKVKVAGEELTSNTRTKYYIIIRKGVVEYKLDSDDIALLGIQKW